ncbi:MAG: hypothetical protein NC340_10135 [Ruminococcus flavefaciens]|nr:hypothetical protein [Ruminococcus flavefaciens]MCM1232809.1 hypothetical protein [Ruminococcus flavefaciens]
MDNGEIKSENPATFASVLKRYIGKDIDVFMTGGKHDCGTLTEVGDDCFILDSVDGYDSYDYVGRISDIERFECYRFDYDE